MWSTEHIEIETSKKAKKPVVIMAFSTPGRSLAPVMAGGIFADKLKMDQIGRIDSEFLPPVMGIMNGEIQFPVAIYHYGKDENNEEDDDEIIVIAGPGPAQIHSYQFCKDLMRWIKSLDPKEVVILSTAGGGSTKLAAFGAATEEKIFSKFKELAQVQPIPAGALMFYEARIMAECLRKKIPGIILMPVEMLILEEKRSAVDPKEIVLTLLEALNNAYLEGKIDFQQAVRQINAPQAPTPAVAAASQATYGYV